MENRKLSRRDFLCLSAAAATGALVAACAPAAPQIIEVEKEVPVERVVKETVIVEKAAPPEKKEVTFWYTAGETAPCVFEVGVDSFNQQDATRKVEASQKADLPQIIFSALAAGAGPDIFPTHGPSYTVQLAQADLVLNLDPFIDKYGWDERFAAWSLDVGKVGGTLYCLPNEVETIVLWYNKTVFEDNGWEPPTTTDELVALCEKIEGAGIIPFAGQAGECEECNEWYFIEFMNKVAGPDKFYRALIGEIPWTDPGFEEGIALLTDMMQRGWWMGDLKTFLATTFDEYPSSLATGEAAMNMEGTWFYGAVDDYFTEDNPNEWAIAPFPSKTGDAIYSIGLGSAWSGNSATKYPDVVGEFLNHYFSPEIQGEIFSKCALAPAAVGVKAEQMEGVDPRIAKALEDMNVAFKAGNYGYTTWTFFPPKSLAYVYENLESVWLREITAAEYLQGLDEIFAEELVEGAVPPIPKR